MCYANVRYCSSQAWNFCSRSSHSKTCSATVFAITTSERLMTLVVHVMVFTYGTIKRNIKYLDIQGEQYLRMAGNFDEKSGIVPCITPWGQWYQTMEEVTLEVNVPEGTTSKEIKVDFKPKHLTCRVRAGEIKGELFERVLVDDCLWSLEDRKKVQIMLVKSRRSADNCWPSLFVDQYKADPLTFDDMEKKMTLERFQKEFVDDQVCA
ncbi:nudC domain-containing protein 2-like isoform X2 [Apostichopus japonicus]|uniref:nudC domain-containing protein 2-like isoform X2 n=1 Tax=Stichopus japonicus TaxID=307972 RepID=UPI003AB651AD